MRAICGPVLESGTYVREDPLETFLRATPPGNKASAIRGNRRVGRNGRVLARSMSAYSASVVTTDRPFHGGLPALDAFVSALAARCAARMAATDHKIFPTEIRPATGATGIHRSLPGGKPWGALRRSSSNYREGGPASRRP